MDGNQIPRVREDVSFWLDNVCDTDEARKAHDEFSRALKEIETAHPELHSKLSKIDGAANDLITVHTDAAFAVGYQVGRDPAAYLFVHDDGETEVQP